MKIKLYFELSWSNSCNMSRLLLLLMWVVYCSGVKALDFRLPSHVVPKSYSIELNPEYEKTNNLFGVVKIEVMCVIDGSKNITLHAKNINITHMDIIDKVSGNNINITNSSAGEVGTDFVVIHLSTNLNIGSDYILTMNYTTIFIEPDDYEYDLIYDSNDETNDRTTLDDNTPYVYEDNTKGFMFNNGVYYTNMMPIYARTVFPCFDEPSFKSVFNITLRRPKNMISISNMPINQTITPGNSVDFVSDIFKSTPLMSTHLVAFVITNYTNETILSNNTQLRIWTPEDDKSKTCLAKSVSPTLYRYLNQYFGKNLPITKQDMITIPANISFNYIAMENWGLSTFQSEALLIEENVTSVSSLLSKDEIVLEISQMLTHQWMGDLVTISWWCDLWLTVGSTSYLSYLVSTKIFPDDRAWDIFLIFVFQEAMEKDSPLVPVTMKKIIRNNGEIPNGLDSLTYFKSASFIRMLSGIIGENDLHMVYRNLMAKYELKNIDEDLFWKEIDGVVSSSIKPSILNNMTMKALMGPWLTQAGYPVIHVSPNFENGSIQIYQENFNARDKVINNLWWVPLKYNIIDKNENGTIKLIWLNNTKMNQTFQDTDLKKSFPCLEPVVFNINQTGYYRVNYNDDNWKLITRYLRLNHSRIYKYNRAQLIDDSFSLAMEGFLSYLIPFKITTYLPNEDEPLIWITFFKKLLEITKIIFRIENNEKIKVYLRNITQKLFEKYQKKDPKPNDFLNKNVLELSTASSCMFDSRECINISMKAVEEWMKNETKVPNGDLFKDLVCTAIRNGNESVWNFVASQNASNIYQQEIIMGLACSKNKSIIKKYLNMTRENQTFNSTAKNIFEEVIETQNGRSSFIEFLRIEYDRIIELKDGWTYYITQFLYKTLELSDNKMHFDEVSNFIKEKKIKSSEGVIKLIAEEWEKNQANVKIVNDWLQEKVI